LAQSPLLDMGPAVPCYADVEAYTGALKFELPKSRRLLSR